MAYRWNARRDSRANLRRLARKQLSAAIDSLETPSADRADAIHDARLHLKKLRALLRLARKAAPDAFRAENAALRDVARALSTPRDRQAMTEAFDKLLRRAQDEWAEHGPAFDAVDELRLRFIDDQRQKSTEVDLDGLSRQAAGRLRQAVDRVEHWTSAAGACQAIAVGFADSYRRARKSLAAVLAGQTAQNLHEWRKQIKYHRYQVRLFQTAWPAILQAHYQELKRLSDLLGDDHDLVILGQAVSGGASLAPNQLAIAELARLIERRRGELQAEAVPLGRLLFAEKPKRLTRRFMRYWRLPRRADH